MYVSEFIIVVLYILINSFCGLAVLGRAKGTQKQQQQRFLEKLGIKKDERVQRWDKKLFGKVCMTKGYS